MTPGEMDDIALSAFDLEEWEEERGGRGRGGRPGRRPPRPRPRPRPRPWPRPRPLPPWSGWDAGPTGAEPSGNEPGGGAPEPASIASPPESERVRWIQSSLNQIMGLRLPVDGVMGPDTRSAVRSFQRRSGLPADGIVGRDTERALIAARARPSGPSGQPARAETELGELPTATSRTSVPYVRWIQQAEPRDARGDRGHDAHRSRRRARGGAGRARDELPRSRCPRLVAATRPGRSVTELVVHETETWSVADTVAVLKKRGLGVHLILGPDGAYTQHGDLGDDVTSHASNHNGRSVGVEVVTPIFERNLGLYRRLRPRGAPLPWTRTMPVGWLDGGSYVLPTPAQAEALVRLVAWITSPAAGLSVPRRWIGVAGGRFAMRLVAGAEGVTAGVCAHSHISAAKQDGPWLVLYAWLRLEAGRPPQEAYQEAAQLAATSATSLALPVPTATSTV